MSSISSAYDKAVKVYSDYLPQLRAKYNNVLTQLTNELATSQAKQNQYFGSQQTQLTNDIAKRGLTAKPGDQFFDTQQSSLKGNQNIQSNDLLNKYAKLRNTAVTNENQGIMGINSSIANLNTQESAQRQAQNNWIDEQRLAKKRFKYTKKQGRISNNQWLRSFNQNKSNSDRSYGLSMSKYNLSSANKPTAKQEMLKDIYGALSGVGNYAPHIRELIAKSYKGKIDNETIQKYIRKYMPNNWENKAKNARFSN